MNLVIKKLGKLLGPKYRKKLYGLVFAQAFLSFFDLIFLTAISLSIYSFSTSRPYNVILPFISRQVSLSMSTLAILLFLSALIRGIGSLYIQVISNKHFSAREAEFSTMLAHKFLNQKWDEKVKSHSSNFLQIYGSSITYIFNLVFRQAIQQVGELFTLTAIVGGLLILRPEIALVSLLYFLILTFLILKFTVPKLQQYGLSSRELAKENLRAFLEVQNISREIVMSQTLFPILKNLMNQRFQLGEIEKKRSFFQSMPRHILELSLVIGFSVALLTTRNSIEKYEILQTVALITAASFRILPSINSIIIGYGNFRNAIPYLNNVFEIADELQLDFTSATFEFEGETQPIRRFSGDLVLEDLSFGYTGGKNQLIQNVTFQLSANKTLWITGESGVGKSTLLMLILGLINPQSGKIYEKFNDESLPIGNNVSGISYLSQEFVLLDETFAYNIALRPTFETDEQPLRIAAQSAGILQLIDSLENGLQATVGEGGNRLSRGEKQRLGLARALFSNPQLLILDEPTANLDTENENVIWESLRSLHGKISVIIVSHRKVPTDITDLTFEMLSK